LKKILVFPVMALAVAVLAHAQAQTPAQSPAPPPAARQAPPMPSGPAPTKIAILHVQNAILQTKDGQNAMSAINTKFGPTKAKFDKDQADLQALMDQMKKGSATMSDDARVKLQREIDQKQTALKRSSEDAQAELDQEENKLFQDIGNKMYQLVQQYATQNGFAVVLNVSDPQTPVMWASAAINIQEDIVKLYDQAHPATVAPAAPKPAAAAPAPKATPPAQKKGGL
jgi:outer membrane protein